MEEKVINMFDLYPLELEFGIIFYILLFFAFVFFIYFIFKTSLPLAKRLKLKEKKKKEKIDLKDTKRAAYRITFMIYKYHTPYNQQLLQKLERYKYRKSVEPFDQETLKLINMFLKQLRKKNV